MTNIRKTVDHLLALIDTYLSDQENLNDVERVWLKQLKIELETKQKWLSEHGPDKLFPYGTKDSILNSISSGKRLARWPELQKMLDSLDQRLNKPFWNKDV